MSGKLMGEVLGLALKGSQREVLLSLANHAYDDGSESRPGLKRICWETGLSRRQVIRTLQDLEQLRYIVAVAYPNGGRGADGQGRATEYRLCLHLAPQKEPFEGNGDNLAPLDDAGAGNGAKNGSNGDISASNGAKFATNGDISASNGAMAEFKSAHQPSFRPSGIAGLLSSVEPAGARARASHISKEVDFVDDEKTNGHDVALPGLAAAAVPRSTLEPRFRPDQRIEPPPPRCVKCGGLQADSARPICSSPAWHDAPVVADVCETSSQVAI